MYIMEHYIKAVINENGGKKFFPVTYGEKTVLLAIKIANNTFWGLFLKPTRSNYEKFLWAVECISLNII